MPEDKIKIQHPLGKRSVAIDKLKYDLIHDAILRSLEGGKQLTHLELVRAVRGNLKHFPGSVPWYLEWVKLDMEAHKSLKRITAGAKPELYRLMPARA